MTAHKNRLYQILGGAFFLQALIPLVGGLLFSSLESEDIETTMTNLISHVSTVYISMILWIVAAVVVVVLGAALYRTAGHINPTAALIGFGLYLFEAVLVIVGQAFVYGLLKSSQLYLTNGDTGLASLGAALLSGRHFAGEIAMVPFGVGAILFYSLLLKAGTIPKWLAIYGLITAPLILIFIPLGTFGVATPFALCCPYVPFEFFTGIFLLAKYRKSADPVRTAEQKELLA
jgi:hypothetical protein